MISHQSRIYIAITVIFVAVILLGIGTSNLFPTDKNIGFDKSENKLEENFVARHVLNGAGLEDISQDFFAVAIMFDNAYDARPQYGLGNADIVYEALAEGNITRLLGIFDSQENINKIGPVRSARPYFMDWAGEYGGVYMHVGGSPDALSSVGDYDFYNIDQIGAGEIYFWRDNNLKAPHNVFTSSSNWLRAGEMKDIPNINAIKRWNVVDISSTTSTPENFSIDFVLGYNVDWKYNKNLESYLRWQGDDKFIYNTGEQARAANVIVQVASSKIVDAKERRIIKTQAGGKVFVFNKFGRQDGAWEVIDGRTRFFDENKNELELVSGQTWIQVIPSEEYFITD
jgi:hypothetical protein